MDSYVYIYTRLTCQRCGTVVRPVRMTLLLSEVLLREEPVYSTIETTPSPTLQPGLLEHTHNVQV